MTGLAGVDPQPARVGMPLRLRDGTALVTAADKMRLVIRLGMMCIEFPLEAWAVVGTVSQPCLASGGYVLTGRNRANGAKDRLGDGRAPCLARATTGSRR